MLEGTAAFSADRSRFTGPVAVRPAPSENRPGHLARLSALSLFGLGRAVTPDPEAEGEATEVASAWLHLLDRGRYAVGRAAAAATLREAISEEDWLTAVRTARGPLGRCVSRELESRGLATLPGEVGPRWAVIHFRACFEGPGPVTETVAASQEADGHWRVAAYFVGGPADR